MVRIGAEETYRCLETFITRMPGNREAFRIDSHVASTIRRFPSGIRPSR
jgi:hypothetical protein